MKQLQLGNHGIPFLHPLDGIRDHLVHDSLGALLLPHHCRGLAHEEWPSVVHGLVIDILGSFKVMFDGNDTFAGQVLDLLCSILFPILDVRIVAHPEWSSLIMIINPT